MQPLKNFSIPILFLAAATTLSTATAQRTVDTLVGVTHSTAGRATSIDTQIPLLRVCPGSKAMGNPLSNNGNTMAGGTAYDPRHQAVWATDSKTIILYRLSDKKTLCSFPPTLQLPNTPFQKSVVSGLAFSPSRRELYQVETYSNAMAVTIYNVSTISAANCTPPVKKLGAAKLGITGEWCGGLAFDEARSLFYYVTTWAGFAGNGSTIYAAPYAKPYKTVSIAFSPCSRGAAATGLGYGNCSKFLYVATAAEFNVVQMTDPLNNKTTHLGCCKKNGASWAGMAVMPTWGKSARGSSCLAQSCAACSSMKLDLAGGDAVLGNPDLAVTITGAPTNSTGAFYVSIGGCTTGTGLTGLCGLIYPAITGPFPLLLGVFGLGGSGTCGGALNLKVGIPTQSSLCNTTACTQFLIRCPQGGLAAVLTNGLELKIGG